MLKVDFGQECAEIGTPSRSAAIGIYVEQEQCSSGLMLNGAAYVCPLGVFHYYIKS